jgi:Uma2 family endonuclease
MPAIAQPEAEIRRITVAEYLRMGRTGILAPDERVELLDGSLIAMPPMGPSHAYSVGRLAKFMVRRFGEFAHISVQGPITLDAWSEPQPDLMLSAPPDERYASAHPKPEDALLVVEVAQSSLRFDVGTKLRAYARRGVREYWIVDLVHERIDVHRDPQGERYRAQLSFERGASVAPAAFPDEPIAVDEILPPLATR